MHRREGKLIVAAIEPILPSEKVRVIMDLSRHADDSHSAHPQKTRP